MIEKINQHIISYNLNYRSEFAVKLTASKVVAIRKGSPFLHGFHGKKKRKEKRKYSNSTKSNGRFYLCSFSFCCTLFLNSHQSFPVVGHDGELGTELGTFPIAI